MVYHNDTGSNHYILFALFQERKLFKRQIITYVLIFIREFEIP